VGDAPVKDRRITVLAVLAVLLTFALAAGVLAALEMWPFDKPSQPAAEPPVLAQTSAPAATSPAPGTTAPTPDETLLPSPTPDVARFCALINGELAGFGEIDLSGASTEDLKTYVAQVREAGGSAPAGLDDEFAALDEGLDAWQLTQETGEPTTESQTAMDAMPAAWEAIRSEAQATCS
jgi:hypothetical protein